MHTMKTPTKDRTVRCHGCGFYLPPDAFTTPKAKRPSCKSCQLDNGQWRPSPLPHDPDAAWRHASFGTMCADAGESVVEDRGPAKIETILDELQVDFPNGIPADVRAMPTKRLPAELIVREYYANKVCLPPEEALRLAFRRMDVRHADRGTNMKGHGRWAHPTRVFTLMRPLDRTAKERRRALQPSDMRVA